MGEFTRMQSPIGRSCCVDTVFYAPIAQFLVIWTPTEVGVQSTAGPLTDFERLLVVDQSI